MTKETREIVKLKKRIIHLTGKIKKDVDLPCLICGANSNYSEEFDSYYCPKCLHWLERICPDRDCCYCKNKPKYPVKGQR